MTIPRMTVLVVGATGSIGRLVVDEAIRQGHAVRALVRDPDKARQLQKDLEAKGNIAGWKPLKGLAASVQED